jgi:hypothetical protein
MDDQENASTEASRQGPGRPAGAKNKPKADTILSPETVALAEMMVASIGIARPSSPAPTVDELVAQALDEFKIRTASVYPEYWTPKMEIKAAA